MLETFISSKFAKKSDFEKTADFSKICFQLFFLILEKRIDNVLFPR